MSSSRTKGLIKRHNLETNAAVTLQDEERLHLAATPASKHVSVPHWKKVGLDTVKTKNYLSSIGDRTLIPLSPDL